jgi:hypothetical protein
MRGGNNNMRGGDHDKLQAAAATSGKPITFNSDSSKGKITTNFEILQHYFDNPPADSTVDTILTFKNNQLLVDEFKANQVAITEYMLEQAGLVPDDVKKSAAFAAQLIKTVGVETPVDRLIEYFKNGGTRPTFTLDEIASMKVEIPKIKVSGIVNNNNFKNAISIVPRMFGTINASPDGATKNTAINFIPRLFGIINTIRMTPDV